MSLPALKLTRSHVGRVVHIHTLPRTTNIGETREIQRILSRFGEIEYFRSLRYDLIPSAGAVVIYKTRDAADLCLSKSPIMFSLGVDEDERRTAPQRVGGTFASRITPLLSAPFGEQSPRSQEDQLPTPPAQKTVLPFGDDSVLENSKPPRLYRMHVNRSLSNVNRDIESSHYHGHFSMSEPHTARDDLARKVPVLGMSHVAWRQEKRPMRKVLEERDQTESNRARWIPLRELYNASHGSDSNQNNRSA